MPIQYSMTKCQLFIKQYQFLINHQVMRKVSTKIYSQLTFISRQNFSKMLEDRLSNPIKQRVMSTPTWPVPYYQRIHRAYPVREEKKVDIGLADMQFGDANWYSAKQSMKQSLKGRQIVQYTENNVNTKSYQIRKEDCESMVRSYVNDVSQFLDIANRENVKIIGGKTLI